MTANKMIIPHTIINKIKFCDSVKVTCWSVNNSYILMNGCAKDCET